MSLPQDPEPEEMTVIGESTIVGIEIRDAIIQGCQLKDVTIVNCKVTKCSIHNGKILDGSLSFVTLTNSNITRSQILQDIIARETSFSQLCAWKSAFVDCTFDESRVIRSEIRDGKIDGCQIQTSQVIGVTGRNSTLTKCLIVQKCKFQDTNIHDAGQLSRTSMKKCNITTAVFKLEKLPTEIRLLLFRRYLEANNCYPTDLLKALFPVQELWFEAIQLYCEMTPLFLNGNNQNKFGCFDNVPLFARGNLVDVHISASRFTSLTPLPHLPKPRKLYLLDLPHASPPTSVFKLVKPFLTYYSTLNFLSINFTEVQGDRRRGREVANKIMNVIEVIGMVSQGLGCKGDLKPIEEHGGKMGFLFRAKEGRSLVWKEGSRRENVRFSKEVEILGCNDGVGVGDGDDGLIDLDLALMA